MAFAENTFLSFRFCRNSSFRIRLFSFSSAFFALNSSYFALRKASLASLSASVRIFLAGPFFLCSFFYK